MAFYPLIEAIEDNGPPRLFTADEVQESPDLFHERAALFYTPTVNIPLAWVGKGILDVTIPIVPPTFFEFMEIRWYQTPRFWVDLLQRASGKIRWTPMAPADVSMIRYDTIQIRQTEAIGGAKSLLDALKEMTYGRSDGHPLYYFGAIVDDDCNRLSKYEFKQVLVANPSMVKCRIVVKPSPKKEAIG
jgi:hypothetical protein